MGSPFLMVTLDTDGPSQQYNDYFEEDFFHWDSQYSQHINSPQIQKMVTGVDETLLFARISSIKIKNKTPPFIYCGRIEYSQHDPSTANPVHLVFEAQNFIENATGGIKQIYDWSPSKKGITTKSNISTRGKTSKRRARSQGFETDPIISHSWEVFSGSIAIKHLDKSAFHHHGTGIPAEIRSFFGLEDFLEGENPSTTLLHKGKSFSAHFQVDPTERLRLFWKTDFDDVLKKELPGWFEKFSESEKVNDEPPVIRFEKLTAQKNTYSVELISNEDAIQLIDDTVEQEIKNNTDIDETERKALVSARRGQGRFRKNLASIEKCCRITRVTDPRLLRASHIKPWRSCSNNHERLDGFNGLLLAPHIDHLFDRGYISFSDEGNLLISPRVNSDQLSLLGISLDPLPNVGSFTKEQKNYLEFHRTKLFKTA